MNQDTYGDFLMYQECPGMAFDLTRSHKCRCQEVTFRKISKVLTELGLCSTTWARIPDLRWTQLESALKIIRVDVENSSFGYGLTIRILVKRGISPCYWRTL